MAIEYATCPTCTSRNPFEGNLLGPDETAEMHCQGCGKKLAVQRAAVGSGIVVREQFELKPQS